MTGVLRQLLSFFALFCLLIAVGHQRESRRAMNSGPDMFNPQSTPAHSILDLSILVHKVGFTDRQFDS
jgi:hypothetical protein